jgi:hypothetical protein
MKARLKTPERDVWQYGSQHPVPRWVRACTDAYGFGSGLYLVRRSGSQRIEPGDWLIRDLDGEAEWVTDTAFRRHYELVGADNEDRRTTDR